MISILNHKSNISILDQLSLKNAYLMVRAGMSLKHVLPYIDDSFFNKIKNKYPVSSNGYKYLNYKYWMIRALRDYYLLGLNSLKSQKILDIGTGTAYFPFICKIYGHQPIAIDLPHEDIYNDVINQLKIERIAHKVNAFQDLPKFKFKFDLVTAFSIQFNNYKKDNVWSVQEWKYFINNIVNNVLEKNGRIYLSLNLEKEGVIDDVKLLRYFKDCGGIVKGKNIYFNKLTLL